MTETAESDPLAGFAALMSGAAQDADPAAENPAPWGYTRDEATGEMRPKKSPGRPRKSPSLEDLKARKEADPAPGEPSGDRPPAAPKGRRRRGHAGDGTAKAAPPVPQALRMEGSIAKGINRLYRRSGKILIALGAGPEGRALTEITRADDPDDLTVGDAWEALCRSNPRVRAFWVRALSGSAAAQVAWAHVPVAVAFLSRPGVGSRIPFWRVAMAMATDEEEAGQATAPEGAPGDMFAGVRQEDMAQMAYLAEQVFTRAQGGMPPRGDNGQPGS